MTGQITASDIEDVLREDLRACRYSREEVAIALAEIAGRAITPHNIDAWIAHTKPHRFPAELVVPWVRATGSKRLLEVLCEGAGMHAAEAMERDLAELGRAQIEREKADERVRQLKVELWRKV